MSSNVSIPRSPTTVMSRTFLGLSHETWRLTITPSGYQRLAKTASSIPGLIQEPP